MFQKLSKCARRRTRSTASWGRQCTRPSAPPDLAPHKGAINLDAEAGEGATSDYDTERPASVTEFIFPGRARWHQAH